MHFCLELITTEFYFQANFAPESETAGTKFDTRTGRPDWAVQSSITPVKAGRPPPPELKPSAAMLGNARDARKPPGINSNLQKQQFCSLRLISKRL